MDNWALRENNDSPVEVNGFVDNMPLLWKMGFEPPLMPNDENDTSQSFTEFNQSTSTSDLPDDDDLVDKLFRESMQGRINKQIQDFIKTYNSLLDMHQHQAMESNIEIKQTDNSLNMLLSSPPPINAPIINRKRSRSPVNMEQSSSTFVPVEQSNLTPQETPQQLQNDSRQLPQPSFTQPLTHHHTQHSLPQQPIQQQSLPQQQTQQQLLLQQQLQARQPMSRPPILHQNLPHGISTQAMAQQQHQHQHGAPSLPPISEMQQQQQQQQQQVDNAAEEHRKKQAAEEERQKQMLIEQKELEERKRIEEQEREAAAIAAEAAAAAAAAEKEAKRIAAEEATAKRLEQERILKEKMEAERLIEEKKILQMRLLEAEKNKDIVLSGYVSVQPCTSPVSIL